MGFEPRIFFLCPTPNANGYKDTFAWGNYYWKAIFRQCGKKKCKNFSAAPTMVAPWAFIKLSLSRNQHANLTNYMCIEKGISSTTLPIFSHLSKALWFTVLGGSIWNENCRKKAYRRKYLTLFALGGKIDPWRRGLSWGTTEVEDAAIGSLFFISFLNSEKSLIQSLI